MPHLKIAPWPASQSQLNKGVLTIAHIYGAAPFPCPRPCVCVCVCGGGGVQEQNPFPPSICSVGFPKSVLAKCSIFWRVVNVHMISSLEVVACCMLREAIL